MAMFIEVDHHGYSDDRPITRQWHVGEKLQIHPLLVISVQADGDELEAIYATCGNIPTSNNRVVTWHGDFAKFIVSNVVNN